GQPLDRDTRAFMEPRFGHDFSKVRVHCDSRAAQSADAVNARAYAVGDDIVFGRGEYAPESAQGKSLMAHELAHVVQHSAYAPPALRRAAKSAKTSAGEYMADPYDAQLDQGSGGVTVGFGADIVITFKAYDRVDATKIASIQKAISTKDGKHENKSDTDKEKKVSESRAIPTGKPEAGAHIDQKPESRTPLFGMSGASGNDLSHPEPSKAKKLTEIGWHYKDASGALQNNDA